MPAIVALIIQGIQVGITLTPEIVSSIQEIVSILQNPQTPPTAQQWQTLDAGLNSILTQQKAILAQNTTASAPA